MTLRSFAFVAALLGLVFAQLGRAALAAGSLSYDDPGMHFTAPDGWDRLDLTASEGSDHAPAAVFTYHAGKPDARSIVITITQDNESLTSFEGQHEQELRQNSDTTFINKKKATQLANGMPVYFVTSSSTSQNGGFVYRFEYVLIDGQRGITVSYVGGAGANENDALAALSSLYVVAYPGRRPSS